MLKGQKLGDKSIRLQTAKCKACKKEFQFYPSKQLGNYCSIKCRQTGWSNKEELLIKCLFCNKEFQTYPALKSKYCSRDCADKGMIGSVGRHTGHKATPETIKKLSVSHLGITAWNKGLKGFNSDFPRNKEWIEKISLAQKGKPRPQIAGENNYRWKGGITPINIRERVRFRQTIQKEILKRDNYTCVFCGSHTDLTVDHIQSWAKYVELRFELDNCRTLCSKCHYKLTYGKEMPDTVKKWGHNLERRIAK